MNNVFYQETQNKRTSLAISIGFHALLLILFITTGWMRAPYPEGPGPIGVQVNFGTSDVGMGDDQSQSFNNTNTNNEDASPNEPASNSNPVDPTPVQEVDNTPVENTEDDNTLTSNESPVEINAKPEPAKKSTPKNVEKPVAKTETKTTTANGGGGKDGASSSGSSGSNGDDNVMGDKGKLYGEINNSAIYDGKPGNGGGGGPSLDIDGWNWDKIPNQVDHTTEKGFVEFEFEVDERGNVISSRVKKRTLSPSVVAFYKNQLDNLTFSPTGKNIINYKGTIKFEVKAR